MKTVEKFKITCIVSNDCYMGGIKAAHGVSYLIEINGKKILMDVATSAEVLLHNMGKMNINLDEVDYLILTHGHYDHGDALPKLIYKIKDIPFLCPNDIFKDSFKNNQEIYKFFPEKGEKINVTIKNKEKIKELKEIRIIEKPTEIIDGLMLNVLESKEVNEICLYVNIKDKGIVIITGCAHPGILKIIEDAKRVTGIDKIYGIIGGLHLKNKSEEKIKEIADRLKEGDVDFILTGHCTGFNALKIFDNIFGEKLKGLDTTRTFSTGQEVMIS